MTVGVSGVEALPPCPLLGPLRSVDDLGRGGEREWSCPSDKLLCSTLHQGRSVSGVTCQILAFPATVPELAFVGVGMDQEYLGVASLACSCWSW